MATFQKKKKKKRCKNMDKCDWMQKIKIICDVFVKKKTQTENKKKKKIKSKSTESKEIDENQRTQNHIFF